MNCCQKERFIEGAKGEIWWTLLEGVNTYVDWTSNIDDRNSTSGGELILGKILVSWTSKKQNCISQSTVEAKYVDVPINCWKESKRILMN